MIDGRQLMWGRHVANVGSDLLSVVLPASHFTICFLLLSLSVFLLRPRSSSSFSCFVVLCFLDDVFRRGESVLLSGSVVGW